MKMKNRLFLIQIILLIGSELIAQPNTGSLPNENIEYKPFIKTVLLYKAGFEMSSPVILLNSNEKLELTFDDLDSDLKHYKYTIVHCESDWTTSTLVSESDYIDGFREEQIDQHSYSNNTTVHYTHFSTTFPSDNMRPKISGNYIMKVYIEDPAEIAFTRRFSIVESSPVGITGEVHQATNPAYKYTKQKLDFEVHLNGMRIGDPSREIRIVIRQNDRIDNANTTLKPRFNSSDVLDYNYDEENNFNGGNEFRNFDTKSLMYQSERINKIEYDSGVYRVYLLDDLKRTSKNYISDKDINGRMVIRCDGHPESGETEADYAWVHFFLKSDIFITGPVYIVGALTGWEVNENSKMKYNPSLKGYEKWIYLKQGYYNYLFVLKDAHTSSTDESVIEGSHWETENVYTVFVYLHELGGMTDRLIGVQDLGSTHN